MKRLPIHLSADNLEQSIQFYSTRLGCAPAVKHHHYAKCENPVANIAIKQAGFKPARPAAIPWAV